MYKRKKSGTEYKKKVRERITMGKKTDEDIEDTTMYGEFITTYFSWLTLDKQKEITKRLEDITKKKD